MKKISPAPTQENPSATWADLFVDELARGGLRDVCIAPGSRSTPLTLAFFNHPRIAIHRHLDERSAAFFGLGLALAGDRPVALLCTSGTAAANFYPAIIEAYMSQVPLLVMTADRPPELRHSGANQTIDQVKMFGDHVLWAVDAGLPEDSPPDIALRNLRTMAARALAVADGFRKGPVHLNFPFRRPLEPADSREWRARHRADDGESRRPFTRIERGTIRPSPRQLNELLALLDQNERGLIICGPRSPSGDFAHAVAQLGIQCGYPVLADALSGVRFGPHIEGAPICGAYETFLQNADRLPRPELILHFGAAPVSSRLNGYLAGCDTAQHIQIRESGVWADGNHRTNYFLQLDPIDLCLSAADRLHGRRQSSWLAAWLQMETRTWAAIDEAMQGREFDGAIVAELVNLLPKDSLLLAGNSLPVRHVDQYARPLKKSLQVFANRGASGIDGNVSTGLGLAAGFKKPVTVLTGDITFYHDSNGLFALKEAGFTTVTFVVLNNNGGGIFRRLPIAEFEPPFQELFQVPHSLDLSGLAAAYGLAYENPANAADLRTLMGAAGRTGGARLIEMQSSAEEDHRLRGEIDWLVKQELAA